MHVVLKIAIFASKLINCQNTVSSAQRGKLYRTQLSYWS